MEALGETPYEKNYHQGLIRERTEELIKVLENHMAKANYAASQQLPEDIPESVPELPPIEAPPPSPPELPEESLPSPSEPPEELPPSPQMPPLQTPVEESPGTSEPPSTETAPEQRTFTLEELREYNGEEGRPAYVAVNGIVYDVSHLIGWAGGMHFGLYAGNDLSRQFFACHRGLLSVLEGLPVVGVLVSD